jgi:hypothetical protein
MMGRYKRMAEMYWKKTHPAKAEAPPAPSANGHHAARGEDRGGHGGHGARGGGQFHFDGDVARRVFESRDRERSGYLEIPQLLKIAEEIWAQLEPDAPVLGQESKQVRPPSLLPRRAGGARGGLNW